MKTRGREEIKEAVTIALLIAVGEVVIETVCDVLSKVLEDRRRRKKKRDDEESD